MLSLKNKIHIGGKVIKNGKNCESGKIKLVIKKTMNGFEE